MLLQNCFYPQVLVAKKQERGGRSIKSCSKPGLPARALLFPSFFIHLAETRPGPSPQLQTICVVIWILCLVMLFFLQQSAKQSESNAVQPSLCIKRSDPAPSDNSRVVTSFPPSPICHIVKRPLTRKEVEVEKNLLEFETNSSCLSNRVNPRDLWRAAKSFEFPTISSIFYIYHLSPERDWSYSI